LKGIEKNPPCWEGKKRAGTSRSFTMEKKKGLVKKKRGGETFRAGSKLRKEEKNGGPNREEKRGGSEDSHRWRDPSHPGGWGRPSIVGRSF